MLNYCMHIVSIQYLGGWSMGPLKRKPTKKNVGVDQHVGRQLRRRRTYLGLSQSDVAEALGVTFQQVQKYERGATRISASRLHILSEALEVPVSYFFAGLPGYDDEGPAIEVQNATNEHRETRELIRLFHAITNTRQRREFLDLVRTLGKVEA